MNRKASISELKTKAKDALLGNYSVVIVSFVIIFVISYAIMTVFTSIITFMALGQAAAEGVSSAALFADPDRSLLVSILQYIIMAVVTPVLAVIATGFTYVLREVSYGKYPKPSDVFYCIKNHPDRVLVIALINYAVQVVLNIPALIFSETVADEFTGKQFLAYVLILLVGVILNIIYMLYASQSYLVYLDNTEIPPIDCIKRSFSIMRGSVWRLFYLYLTFVGYGLLVVASLGIATLWIAPYMQVTLINFYKDLNENRVIEV